jgi:replicative DNA helicase
VTSTLLEPPPDDGYPPDPDDTTSEALPDASTQAEEALLGAILMAEHVLDDVLPIITAEDFYRPLHGELWTHYLEMRSANRPIDTVTVFEELAGDQNFLRAGGGVWLHNLTRACPTSTNATYYASLIAEKAARRRLVQAGHRIWQIGGSGADLDELQLMARDLVDAAALKRSTAAPALYDIVDNYVDNLDQPPLGVVQTPWPDVDDVLNGGLGRGQLIIVAARPGVGKSIIGVSCAKAAAQLNVPTLMFSLEMPEEEILSRLVADVASVPLSHLVRHAVSAEDHARVLRCADRIRSWPLWLHTRPGITVAEIAAACRQRKREGLGLVIIDQLNLITAVSTKGGTRQEEVARMSRELTLLAKELEIPIVVLHQLNRGPETRAKARPLLADLRESGQIEADAHVVILLHREEDRPGEITLIIAKNRNGRLDDIVLSFSGHYARARSEFVGRNL